MKTRFSLLFKKEESLEAKFKTFSQLLTEFDMKAVFEKKIPDNEEFSPYYDISKRNATIPEACDILVEKKQLVGGFSSKELGRWGELYPYRNEEPNIALNKYYTPFKVSQEALGIITVEVNKNLDYNKETPERALQDALYFEQQLTRKIIEELEPEYFVAGKHYLEVGTRYPEKAEQVIDYQIEFNRNSWRFALSPHPFDFGYVYQPPVLGIAAQWAMLFDHSRPELMEDLKILQEHLTETELRNLIKKFSIRYFEDSRGHIGTIRYPRWDETELSETDVSVFGFATPNFYIRRKLRREGVKLYFGVFEKLCLHGYKPKKEFFEEMYNEETAKKLFKLREKQDGGYIPIGWNQETLERTKVYWNKVKDILTEQERIDFGLNGDFKQEKKSWWKVW